MKIKSAILLILLMLVSTVVHAQNERAHFRIRYIINSPEIDTTFVDNSARISDMREFLANAREDSTMRISQVKFRGTASPDGGYEFNRWLSAARLSSFKQFVGGYVDIPDSIIIGNVSEIPWDGFRERVAESDVPYRDEVLKIIDEGPTIVRWFGSRHIDWRLLKLKKLHKGKVWQALKSPILSDLRFGEVEFEYYFIQPPILTPPLVFECKSEVSLPILPKIPEDMWIPRLHLKTNVLDLGLLVANAAVEVDIARHLSVNVPIYYSGVNYFVPTIKFRTFGMQPALRYWPRRSNNEGFFANVHFGFAYYNLAANGAYRVQDHRGRMPAYGGGLGIGYRVPLSDHWHVEVEIGGGVYPLDYDVFANTNPTVNGQLMDRKRMLYIGPDQASVSFSYAFDLKPKYWKGGKRVR